MIYNARKRIIGYCCFFYSFSLFVFSTRLRLQAWRKFHVHLSLSLSRSSRSLLFFLLPVCIPRRVSYRFTQHRSYILIVLLVTCARNNTTRICLHFLARRSMARPWPGYIKPLNKGTIGTNTLDCTVQEEIVLEETSKEKAGRERRAKTQRVKKKKLGDNARE